MSANFRVEHFHTENSYNFIKIYAKSNIKYLPVEIDLETRFCTLKEKDLKYLESFRNFKVRKDDVWVITQPKCGTTWTLELCWLLMNNLDYETALNVEQIKRTPYLELCILSPQRDSVEAANNTPSPRTIKTHLPIHLLPKDLWTVKPKIVYVTRDVKDVIASSFHFFTEFTMITSTKTEFFTNFLNQKSWYLPFWPHVVEFWKIRNEPYVYFNTFERMKKDLKAVILEISEFLEKPIKDDDMEGLMDHLSFKKMKKNKTCNHKEILKETQTYLQKQDTSSNAVFFRKGDVGSHREEFSEDEVKQIEEWTRKELDPYGLTLEEIISL